MRQMKDSGELWIGVMPSSWALVKGKYLFAQRNERGNYVQLQLLSPTQRYGCIPQSQYEELTGANTVKLNDDTDLNFLKTIHEGDYCISLRSFQGGFEYCSYEGVVSPAYQVFHSIKELCKGYYKYLFKNEAFIAKMNTYTLSLRDGKNISFSDFGNTFLPVPPLAEQERIAAYLDAVTAKIDRAITEAKELIEKYKAYKRSVISEAVTRGLDKNAKMKDSGNPFIGEIPANWSAKKFGYCALVKANLVSPNQYPNYPQLSPDNIIKDSNILLPCQTVEESGVISDNHHFYKGQIIYCKIRPLLNKVTIAPFEGLCSADMYPIETCENTRFLVYAMLSISFTRQVGIKTQDRVKMPKINQEELAAIKMAIPPKHEQEKIADYLDSKCSVIDKMIEKKETLIEELQRYRKSVIYEYVTGKKQVAE